MATTPAAQLLSDFKGDHLSIHMAEAVGDVRCITDAAMTAASNVVTSPSGQFRRTDKGKLIKVYGAGAGQFSPNLYGIIFTVTGNGSATIIDSTGAALPAGRTVSAAKCFVGTDYTAQFQALLGVCNSLYIPFGGYAITGLTVLPGQRIYGQNKGGASGLFDPGSEGTGLGTDGAALGSCLVCFSDTNYAIEYLSDATAGQIQDEITFERLTILAKNGIRINDPTAAAADQSFIHPILCRDVLLQGDYIFDEDPESFTSTLPTATGSANSLDQYGVGFAGAKLLRCEIKDCTFYGYGMATWLVDDSQCSVRHSRLVHCGIWCWHGSSDIPGFLSNRNKFIHNELIEINRKGGIYIEYANGLLVSENWFEQNSAADLTWLSHANPTYIYSEFDDLLEISGNIFLDNYSLTAPLYHLTPRLPALVYGNEYESSGLTHAFAEVELTNYLATNDDISTAPVKIFGNVSSFPVPAVPGVVPQAGNNLYRMAFDSPANIRGAATVTDPWVISSTTGDYVITTATLGFIWLPPIQSPAHRQFRCAVTGLFLGGSTFFVAVYLFNKVANIIGMTAAAPIVVQTAAAHGLSSGDVVFIKDFLATDFTGFPGTGIWTITVVDATHFSLNTSDGTTGGSYRSGGKIFLRSLLNVFNPGITNTTHMQTGYFQFDIPVTVSEAFLGLDTTNDRAEVFAMELFPFEGLDRAFPQQQGFLFKTANYTILPTDNYVSAATSGGAVTLTLPTLASTENLNQFISQRYYIKFLSGAGTLTLDGAGAETIEGSATYVFSSAGEAIIIQNDSTEWKIVAKYSVLAGVWRWVTVNASIRTDYQVGINKDPGASIFLDVNGIIQGTFRDSSLTANTFVKTDGSKNLVSGNALGVTVNSSFTTGATVSTQVINYKDHSGTNQSATVVVSVGTNQETADFVDGIRTV